MDKFYQDDEKGTTLNEGWAYGNPKKQQGEYTLEDYYMLPDDVRVELIDGVLYYFSSPNIVHQDICGYIFKLFSNYIDDKKKPCKVFSSPMDVQLDRDNRTMVQPDVFVVCDRDKLRRFGIYGAPDFVLEVLSKSTRYKDIYIKIEKYMDAGVREYWMIDPEKKRIHILDFTQEDSIPRILPLKGSVAVGITGGELVIDLEPIAQSIKELGSLE